MCHALRRCSPIVRGGRRDQLRYGINTRIVRVLPDGTSGIIAALPDGFDSGHLFALDQVDGSKTLYMDWLECDAYSLDVYRMEVPPSLSELDT
ncbi:MAG: hypothetical protein L0206_04410 [Actinobacteria bacterium]|nr:hypothetical protein [Actinomycetota bacterium]